MAKNRSMTVRTLAEHFSCGKSQIAAILKNNDSIFDIYESNMSVRSRKRSRGSEFSDVNEALHKWYLLAVSRNMYPMGPQLCEKAKDIAERLGFPNFKASNGWLDRWKKRYNVKKMKINAEAGDVSGETIDSWKERLPELLQGYSRCDVWNLDETASFWKAPPDHGFGKKNSQCKGGKKAKQRVTIALLVNANGDKEDAIIIWKSANPRCFRGINKSKLPVQYFSQPKGWMTGDILNEILTKWNRKLRSEGRSIVLVMDNAGCHPQELKEAYTNIKIMFLPPNTTSRLQPLDLGIIQNFKIHYRKLFLRFVISKIDECSTISEVTKSVTVLQAIRWVAQAWKLVKEETICKCFQKAGILDKSLGIASRVHEDQDPFDELDSVDPSAELDDLISQVPIPSCSATEYIHGEDLPTCSDESDETWEDDFFTSLNSDQNSVDEDDPDDAIFDIEPPPLKIKSFHEAIHSLEDVKSFLDRKGYGGEATAVSTTIDLVASLNCSNLALGRQSTLDEFFDAA